MLKIQRSSVYTIILGVFTLSCSELQSLAQTFKHPVVLVDQVQLDFIKSQVNAGIEPFASTFAKAKASKWGSLNYKVQGPPGSGIIECGSYSKPNHGCSLENDDSEAALTQALLWYITGNMTYANNAINIM